MTDNDKAHPAALGAATVKAGDEVWLGGLRGVVVPCDAAQSVAVRDPLTDPIRGDVICYGVKDSDSLFVATVVEIFTGAVLAQAVELHGGGVEATVVPVTESLNKWRDWSDFTNVTVLRRGAA